jgi:hypothetical protein
MQTVVFCARLMRRENAQYHGTRDGSHRSGFGSAIGRGKLALALVSASAIH